MTSHPATSGSKSPPTGVAAWRILFRMLSGIIALFAFAFWAAAGANRGWTKDRIPIKQIDEITGIEFVTYKEHFLPGVELLGLAFFFCVVLFAITFIRRGKSRSF